MSTQTAAAHANATKPGGASTTRNRDSGKQKVPSVSTDDDQEVGADSRCWQRRVLIEVGGGRIEVGADRGGC